MTQKAKKAVIVSLCVLFILFLIYAAATDMGFRLRYERKEFDFSGYVPDGSVAMEVLGFEDNVLTYSFKNNTDGQIQALDTKLLIQKDSVWHEVKSRHISTTPNHPQVSFAPVTQYSNDLPIEKELDFSAYLGVAEMPEGCCMLIRQFYEAGADGGVVREFCGCVEFTLPLE